MSQQSLLDRIPTKEKKSLLDRIPSAMPAEPRQSQEDSWYAKLGHGAAEGFGGLVALVDRLGGSLGDVGGPVTSQLIQHGAPPEKPVTAHDVGQFVAPISPESHESPLVTAGTVAGGLAQLPIVGPAGLPAVAATFGGETFIENFDAAKSEGKTDQDALIRAVPQALLTAATVGILGKIGNPAGKPLTRAAKGAATFVPVGQAEQVVSNWVRRNTGQPDTELWTGIKGRAATDAATGILMSILFPGVKPSQRLQESVAKAKAEQKPTPAAVQPATPPVEAQAAPEPKPTPRPSPEPVAQPAPAREVTPHEAKLGELLDAMEEKARLEAEYKTLKGDAQNRNAAKQLALAPKLRKLALEVSDLGQQAAAAGTGGRMPSAPPVEKAQVQPSRFAQPEAQAAAPATPENVLRDPEYIAGLQGMAGELGTYQTQGEAVIVGGGHEGLQEKGKTNYVNYAEWWDERPSGNTMTQDEIKAMVAKVSENPDAKLGPRQQEMLDWMIERVERDAGLGPYREARLEAERTGAPATEGEWAQQTPTAAMTPEAERVEPSAGWEEDLRAATEETLTIRGEKNAAPIAEHYVRSVKETSDALGEPPGPPKPPAPVEEVPEPSDPNGRATVERWIGERQLAHAHADLRGGLWKKAIDQTLAGGWGKVARFAKERFGPRSQRARALVEEAGQLEIDLRGKLDEEYAKYGDKLTDEQRAILERRANLSPGQRAIIDDVIAHNLELSKVALDEKVISHYYDVYTKRLWKGEQSSEIPPRTPTGTAKFTTFTTGALPRSYSSILEGWANGNELRIPSFVDATVANQKIIADVVANRNLIEAGRKGGWLRSATPGEGWEQIEHPNFRDEILRAKIEAPESAEALKDALSGHLNEEIPLEEAVKVYGRAKEGKTSIVVGRDMRIIPRGNDILVLQKMPLFAPKETARIINNVLGRSGITKFFEQGTAAGSILSGIDKYGVIAKTMMTASIQDNGVFTAMRNFRASPANTPADILTLKPYFAGKRMIEAWGPDAQKLVEVGGLWLRPHADVAPSFELEKGRLSRAMDQMKIVGPAKAFIENAYVDLNNFLYGKFIPAYKMHLAILELARLRKVNREALMRGTVADDALVKQAAQLSNNVFGGQNWERMGTNPTAMHIAQFSVFAPDRMTSTLRLATDAFRAGATGRAHQVLWARMMSRYILLWAGVNFASAWSDDPEHPVKNFAKRARENYGVGLREYFGFDIAPILQRVGRTNQSRIYVDITAQSNEIVDLATHPWRYAGRKLGVVPRLIVSALTGENYFGKRFTTTAELLGTDDKGVYKTTEIGKHYRGQEKGGRLAGQTASYQSGATAGAIGYEQMPSFALENVPLPIELGNWVEVMHGQMDAFDAMLQTLGFRTMAPSAKRQQAAGVGAGGTGDLMELYR